MTASPEGFPPQDLRSFLELCEGEWLSLRSRFDLALVEPGDSPDPVAAAGEPSADDPGAASAGNAATAADADAAPGEDGLPDFAALLAQARSGVEEAPVEEAWHRSERGELTVAFLAPLQGDHPGGLRVTPPSGPGRELHFRGDGSFASAPDGVAEGTWQLWPDGSVELIVEEAGRLLRERIWFTQPNLRLRSSVEQGVGGRPGRARFSSEIRRVRKPAP
ncbi:MAG: phycobiliprotein lyase [Cyanobium sp.]